MDVSAGSTHHVYLPVAVGGLVEWEWELAGLDVQFAVQFTAEGEAAVDVVTSIKVVAGAPVQGSFKADSSGQVSLV